MKQYRAAIVGLSWIAADRAAQASHPVLGTATPYSHASAFAATDNVKVVAGCDIVPAACDAFREQWQSVWPDLRTYTSYRDLFAHEQVDIVSIVTPDHLHADVLAVAAEAGVKGVFCEKPLATNLEDADVMVRIASEHGIVMNINHTRRWAPEFVASRQLVRDGAVGQLAQVIVRFGGPRAMLFRNHTHMLDLINYLAESDPQWVMAELEEGFADYGTVYRGDGGRDPSTEPGLNAYIAYANGVRGYLSGMKGGFEEVVVHLIGSHGTIEVGPAGPTLVTRKEAGVVVQHIIPRFSRAGMHAAVVDLIASLESGETPQSPPEEARKAVALTIAALESQARNNAPVPVR